MISMVKKKRACIVFYISIVYLVKSLFAWIKFLTLWTIFGILHLTPASSLCVHEAVFFEWMHCCKEYSLPLHFTSVANILKNKLFLYDICITNLYTEDNW